MPTDLSIAAVSAVTSTSEVHPEPKTVPVNVTPAEKPVSSTPIYANPKLYLDPQLELVVMEFRDTSGKATTTFPSQRQMEAYRSHQEAVPGVGLPSMPDTPEAMPGQDAPAPATNGASDAKPSAETGTRGTPAPAQQAPQPSARHSA